LQLRRSAICAGTLRSTEENKVVLRRLYEEVWSQGNLATVDELLAADYVLHDPAHLVRGPEGFKAYVATFRAAFPDLHATVEDQIAEEDRAAMRFTARGTHKGEFHGIPPTDNQITLSGTNIQGFVDGKIVENWVSLDALGMLQQLGVIPPMG
jgi:steroid delta-isomerase-like uncharacterized protein